IHPRSSALWRLANTPRLSAVERWIRQPLIVAVMRFIAFFDAPGAHFRNKTAFQDQDLEVIPKKREAGRHVKPLKGHAAMRPVHPCIESIVKEQICEQRINHASLRSAAITYLQSSFLVYHQSLELPCAIQYHPSEHLVVRQGFEDQIISDTVKECTNANLQYPRLVITPHGTLAWHLEPTFRADIHTNQQERSDQIAAPYSALSLPEPPYRPLSGYQGDGPCRCPSECAS